MRLRRAVAVGMALGAVLFLLLFVAGSVSLAQFARAPDPDTTRVLERFSGKVYLTLSRIGLVHLWAGLVLGALCAFFLRVLYPWFASRRVWFIVSQFVLFTAVFAYFALRMLVRQPTFFDQFVFAQGDGVRRLMFFLTESIGVVGIDVLFASALFLLVLCSRAFRSWIPVSRSLRREQLVFVLSAITIGVSLLIRWSWSPPDPEPSVKPNVLILAVDSLRPDHLSFMGYPRPTSPNIDALAGDSLVFEQAFVPVARTLPSWASFLTSANSHTHGIRHMFPESSCRRIPLPTLAECLKNNGYRCGVVSDFAGEMFHLVDFGFDFVDAPPASDVDVLVERQMLLHFPLIFPFVNHWLGKKLLPVIKYFTVNADARTLGRRALRRIREMSEPGPFFLTVFFSTAHAPYASPYPYYKKFTDPSYSGPHRYANGIRDPRDLRESPPDYDPADQKQVIGLYDGAVAHCDAAIGEILDELRAFGFLDSTLVVITADHGEHLFEHGNTLDHGKWFRGGDCANHIPWILHDPVGELGKGRVKSLVRSIDLMPTLLGRLGIEVPGTCEGEDLSPYLRERRELPELTLFAETEVQLQAPVTFRNEKDAFVLPHINEMLDVDPWDFTLVLKPPFDELCVEGKHRMIRDAGTKLVYEPTRVGARWRLYDPESDPGNQDDLSLLQPERFASYRSRLSRWISLDPLRGRDSRDHWILENR